MTLGDLHYTTLTYSSNLTLYHSLTCTISYSLHMTSSASVPLAFFPLPGNPFLLALLDVLLLSFRIDVECQVLFKDFPTSQPLFQTQIMSSISVLPQHFSLHFILFLLNCEFLHLYMPRSFSRVE